MFIQFLLCGAALLQEPTLGLQTVDVQGSPYGVGQCGKECNPQLDVTKLSIRGVEAQGDTFIGVITKMVSTFSFMKFYIYYITMWSQHMGVPVPVWRFKQPNRLSELQLPFQVFLPALCPSVFLFCLYLSYFPFLDTRWFGFPQLWSTSS